MVEIYSAFSTLSHRMRWAVHYLLLLLPTALSYVDSGRILSPIYWNSTNTMFQSSNNDHIIDVNLGDSLNIYCPHYPDGSGRISSSQWEYYLIYMVDKYNYEVCVINDTSSKIPILNCSNPESPKFFTLLIFEFQPIPGIPDFALGKDYYFITTSGGRKFNMDNQYEGACKEHQMKMVLRVRPRETDPATNNSTSRPPTAHPTPAPQPSRTTTTTTTTTSTTTTTTAKPTTRRRPSNSKPPPDITDDNTIPGSDGFPNDEDTVIQVGDGPNINSGVIADDGADKNGALSYHKHRHSVQGFSVVVVSLLISIILLGR